MKLAVREFRKHYLDNLEVWIEVPVWDQKELIAMVNEINWDEISLDGYKKLLVDHWPGLPSVIKTKLDNTAVRNELYDVLLHENWGLSPSEQSYYTEVQMKNVRLWFESKGKRGEQPDIY